MTSVIRTAVALALSVLFLSISADPAQALLDIPTSDRRALQIADLAGSSGVARPADLARQLEVSEKDIVEVGRALDFKDASLDAPLGEGATDTRASLLPAVQPAPDEVVAEEDSRRILREQFARFARDLAPREKAVFQERLAAEEPLTLQELADRFKMTREGMRQVEKRLVRSFKTFVEHEMTGYDLRLQGIARGKS